jgi:hypothetical protein
MNEAVRNGTVLALAAIEPPGRSAPCSSAMPGRRARVRPQPRRQKRAALNNNAHSDCHWHRRSGLWRGTVRAVEADQGDGRARITGAGLSDLKNRSVIIRAASVVMRNRSPLALAIRLPTGSSHPSLRQSFLACSALRRLLSRLWVIYADFRRSRRRSREAPPGRSQEGLQSTAVEASSGKIWGRASASDGACPGGHRR